MNLEKTCEVKFEDLCGFFYVVSWFLQWNDIFVPT